MKNLDQTSVSIALGEEPKPTEPSETRRILGKDLGSISIAEEFDSPIPELEALFYGDDSNEVGDA